MISKRVGIITFHHSYNCGSMLQAFALQTVIDRMGHEARIINLSNPGQRRLYSVLPKPSSIKSLVKDIVLLPHYERIRRNFLLYEDFMARNLHLDGPLVSDSRLLSDKGLDIVVAGSDQVWNTTIEDGDDAYFLPWVTDARKVAYSPSFGAKNLLVHSREPERYRDYIKAFDALSIRERNGKEWLRQLTGLDVDVLIDPTLLLTPDDYGPIEDRSLDLPDRYIFYYSPGYSADINELVQCVSARYGLPVIAFNAKSYYLKGMNFRTHFALPDRESPATYLRLIKNATMVFTTSFHGTVFSAMFRRPFWTVKSGGMLGDDDRVLTLLSSLGLCDRWTEIQHDPQCDYMSPPDYSAFEENLEAERTVAMEYLARSLS